MITIRIEQSMSLSALRAALRLFTFLPAISEA